MLEAIQRDRGGNTADCMLDLVSKWTSNQEGTGTLPRVWQTVVEAVWYCGDRALAQDLAIACKHGGICHTNDGLIVSYEANNFITCTYIVQYSVQVHLSLFACTE